MNWLETVQYAFLYGIIFDLIKFILFKLVKFLVEKLINSGQTGLKLMQFFNWNKPADNTYKPKINNDKIAASLKSL